ncbi:MAG TPA: hypothetical protein VK524_30495 [Polyangiaceae bacterium]|nr:hypothetical protein [Polyangiaceae bacterium]
MRLSGLSTLGLVSVLVLDGCSAGPNPIGGGSGSGGKPRDTAALQCAVAPSVTTTVPAACLLVHSAITTLPERVRPGETFTLDVQMKAFDAPPRVPISIATYGQLSITGATPSTIDFATPDEVHPVGIVTDEWGSLLEKLTVTGQTGENVEIRLNRHRISLINGSNPSITEPRFENVCAWDPPLTLATIPITALNPPPSAKECKRNWRDFTNCNGASLVNSRECTNTAESLARVCPLPRAGTCAPSAIHARDPLSGACCVYDSPCSAPDSWSLFTSAAECRAATEQCVPFDTKTAADGCNSCTCNERGQWLCNSEICPLRECIPADTAGAGDSCSQCLCNDAGRWMCTSLSDPCPVCYPGQTKPGEGSCNTCTCSGAGQWTCTTLDCGDPTPCSMNQPCGASEYCQFAPRTCGSVGTCQPRPTECGPESGIVCSCDGRQFGSECLANKAGASVFWRGACPAPI